MELSANTDLLFLKQQDHGMESDNLSKMCASVIIIILTTYPNQL
jgi:hypothetical protein